MCPASALDKYYVIRLIKCSLKKRKKLKKTWGPTGTPLGMLRDKCGMLLFLLFLGSERCKFEKWPRRQCSEDDIVQMLA